MYTFLVSYNTNYTQFTIVNGMYSYLIQYNVLILICTLKKLSQSVQTYYHLLSDVSLFFVLSKDSELHIVIS